MSYATVANWALEQGYATWAAYNTAHPNFPTEAQLNQDLTDMAAVINFEIGSFADISSSAYLAWLLQLNLQMVHRKYDVTINRKTEPRQLFMPHDFMYADEREKCKTIGRILKYRVRGKVLF